MQARLKEIIEKTKKSLKDAEAVVEMFRPDYPMFSQAHQGLTRMIHQFRENQKDLDDLLLLVTQLQTDNEALKTGNVDQIVKERTVLKRKLTMQKNKTFQLETELQGLHKEKQDLEDTLYKLQLEKEQDAK